MEQRITISTPDGDGEAIKTDRNVPWDVTLPTRVFRFYGSVPEVTAEIRRFLKLEYPGFKAGYVVTDGTIRYSMSY